jgi:hypothetical protein
MLAFVDGIRGGKNYEKDTFRLEKKLIWYLFIQI